MQVIIVNGDVESLASMLNQAIDDAYVAGQQAEKERITSLIADIGTSGKNECWDCCETILEKIDATTE